MIRNTNASDVSGKFLKTVGCAKTAITSFFAKTVTRSDHNSKACLLQPTKNIMC